jgi:hypothetical protein
MDYLDGFVVETEKARDTAVTVFNNFAAILKGMRARLTRAAEEIDQLERQRAALRVKLTAEHDDGQKRLSELNLQIKEADRRLERTNKENSLRRAEIGKILDDVIRGKQVA